MGNSQEGFGRRGKHQNLLYSSVAALLPNPSPEHGQTSAVHPDIWMWLVADAPASIRDAFTGPVPEDGWIIKIAETLAKDIVIEASLISLCALPLVGRVQLTDGGVALLFRPDTSP